MSPGGPPVGKGRPRRGPGRSVGRQRWTRADSSPSLHPPGLLRGTPELQPADLGALAAPSPALRPPALSSEPRPADLECRLPPPRESACWAVSSQHLRRLLFRSLCRAATSVLVPRALGEPEFSAWVSLTGFGVSGLGFFR